MKGNEWKDTTSYSRGERGDAEPRSWSLKAMNSEISVHRHIDYPGRWMVTACVGRGRSELRKLLSSLELKDAKDEACFEASKWIADLAGEVAALQLAHAISKEE